VGIAISARLAAVDSTTASWTVLLKFIGNAGTEVTMRALGVVPPGPLTNRSAREKHSAG